LAQVHDVQSCISARQRNPTIRAIQAADVNMTAQLYQRLAILAFVTTCSAIIPEDRCETGQCEMSLTSAFVDKQVAGMDESLAVDLMQRKSAEVSASGDSLNALDQKCKRRCHYHPKLDCRLICRISCVNRKPIENPKCKNTGPTTTTTTTSKEFTKEDPPSPEQTCDLASSFLTTIDNLKVNTLGMDVESPKLHFKDVVVLSKMLKDKDEYKSRKWDLIVEDASQKPKYVNNPDQNLVSEIYNSYGGLKKYVRDERNYTGSYLGTLRIGIDDAGSYVFRMTLVDSETGEPSPLPLFPLTFYDVDGEGEIVSTCDAAQVVSLNSKLEEEAEGGCFAHRSAGGEVNLPKDFEHLSINQAKSSVTYVYSNKASFDVQLHLDPSTPQRYFIMKSSKVLACTNEFQIQEGEKKNWSGKPKKADA